MTQPTNVVELLNLYYNSPTTQKLRDKFLTPSLFDIIQKDRSETVHSNFLAWLFGMPYVNGIEGFNIISALIQVAYKRALEQGLQNFPMDLAKAAYGATDSIQISGKVTREYRCPGVYITGSKSKSDQKSIVDLVIDGTFTHSKNNVSTNTTPFKIIIENKIASKEHDLQTWKYYTFFEGKTTETPLHINQNKPIYVKSQNEKRIYLFLTPEPNPQTSSCSCKHFIKINYQDIMDSCITPLLQCSRLNPRDRMFLEEYSHVLSLPYLNNKGKTIIMSLNKLDTELLKEFWEANQTLITMSIQALGQSSPEMSKEVMQTLDAINNLEGKRKKYRIRYIPADEIQITNQSNLMYDLMQMYLKFTQKNLDKIESEYDIGTIFCKDSITTGYSKDCLNINGSPLRVTNQKPRTDKQLEKIRTQAAKDGFIIELF